MGRYRKEEDGMYLPMIKKIVNLRPTYGYKRVTAIINKDLEKQGLRRINRKRVYRIMKLNGLILPKSGEVRNNHQGTGKIEVLHSNTRWCSDAFEIKCWNDERVYVAFVLDSCDREAIGYVARKQPLVAADIEELMINSIWERFKDKRAPRTIQFLSDRGCIYRADTVRATGRKLGLTSCYTAPYSPSSNGMAEAFVGTIKRDYVYTNDCHSAKEVLKLLKSWFNDYNINAPHSGLGMVSPAEFIRQNEGVN